MEELLSPVSRTYTKSKSKSNGTEGPLLHAANSMASKPAEPSSSVLEASSVGEVIDVLKNEPDYDTMVAALGLLVRDRQKLGAFDIAASTPDAAKVIHILVTEITPNYWSLLKESSAEGGGLALHLLLDALRNLAGLNAILLRLRTLTQEYTGGTAGAKRSNMLPNLKIVLDLLCEVLDGETRIMQMWSSIVLSPDSMRRRILAREFVNALGGGRIISLSAEGEAIVSSGAKTKSSWTADGSEYTRWLTRNIIAWSRSAQQPEETKSAADLLSKVMHLGYPDAVIKLVLSDLVTQSRGDSHIRAIFENLARSEQKSMLFNLLKTISELYLNKLDPVSGTIEETTVSAAAGLIKELIGDQSQHASHLTAWLTSAKGAGLGDAIGIRRVVLALLATETDNITPVFDKSLTQFGDFLYIKHTPILQQEVHAQVLLLSAGYLQRFSPMKLALLVKGGAFMRMVSKRLEASQTRVRLLGMIVGEALSGLVEKSDKKLDFKMQETKTEEALWYKRLVHVSDVVGPVDPLRSSEKSGAEQPLPKPSPKLWLEPRPARKPAPPPVRPSKAIIEVMDSDEEIEDDIIPMKQPDEDDEESDDDPETVRRDKPKAPVYIRTLITYLRDTEDYDRQKLALITAPTLIRRKANFGTEVKEHAEEMATLLVGLQDEFDIDNFYDLKLQGMIAIVVAQPEKMGPWFARTFFDGDYSIAQRSSVLTVIGLGARELAGQITSEYTAAASLPSQALPEKMKKLYMEDSDTSSQLPPSSTLKALPSSALDTISKSLTSDFMAPIAANAADAATGPDALKLSTFTSRLGQQQQVKSKTRPRVTAIPNTTAQLLATSFFFPLTARFQSAVHSSASRARGIVFQPYLLSLYIKTLALLLHAAGPGTLALPDMTTELWGLLLGSSVRAHAVGDMGVTHAVLFALLTMLEVNDNRMRDICQTMSKEVIETQEWVAQVFGGLRGEDGAGEEAQVKALAAGCLVKIREGMEKYRMLLMGDMIG
ncbi:unnamed protein product [Discula destructiva]